MTPLTNYEQLGFMRLMIATVDTDVVVLPCMPTGISINWTVDQVWHKKRLLMTTCSFLSRTVRRNGMQSCYFLVKNNLLPPTSKPLTTENPEIPGAHTIDFGRMKVWNDHGASWCLLTLDFWIWNATA